MRIPLAAVLVASLASLVLAEEPPSYLKAYLTACDTQRRVIIADAEYRIKAIQRRRISVSNPAAEIADLRESIAKYQNPSEPVSCSLAFPLTVGNCGILITGFKTIQVTGPSEAIIDLEIPGTPGFGTTRSTNPYTTALLRGKSTAGFADGKFEKRPADVFHCSGNYTYDTVSGASNTIMVIEPVDPAIIAKFSPKPAPPSEPKIKPARKSKAR